MEAELVALGVEHRDPVAVRFVEFGDVGRTQRDQLRCPRGSSLGSTPTSRCTRFFAVLPSGTFRKNTRGPFPSGSTIAKARSGSDWSIPKAVSASSRCRTRVAAAARRTPALRTSTSRALGDLFASNVICTLFPIGTSCPRATRPIGVPSTFRPWSRSPRHWSCTERPLRRESCVSSVEEQIVGAGASLTVSASADHSRRRPLLGYLVEQHAASEYRESSAGRTGARRRPRDCTSGQRD